MPTLTDIQFYRGEDVTLEVTMDAPPAGGSQAWQFEFTVRPRPESSERLVHVTDVTVADPDVGVFTVPVASALSYVLTPGVYWYDFARTNAGSRAVLSEGRCTVKAQVSLPPSRPAAY